MGNLFFIVLRWSTIEQFGEMCTVFQENRLRCCFLLLFNDPCVSHKAIFDEREKSHGCFLLINSRNVLASFMNESTEIEKIFKF